MAKKNIDESWHPKLKGDRGKLRDRDKYRDNYDKIFKKQGGIDDGTGSDDREESVRLRQEPRDVDEEVRLPSETERP